MVQTDWDNDEAIIYMQGKLERMGVEKALAEAGAMTGDEIRILGRSFTFQNSQWDSDEPEVDVEWV